MKNLDLFESKKNWIQEPIQERGPCWPMSWSFRSNIISRTTYLPRLVNVICKHPLKNRSLDLFEAWNTLFLHFWWTCGYVDFWNGFWIENYTKSTALHCTVHLFFSEINLVFIFFLYFSTTQLFAPIGTLIVQMYYLNL